jgi:pentatricopeptide repeat protein
LLRAACAQGFAKYGTDVALARLLHEQYEALGGDRIIWLYTCRIRLHGRIRDIETCIELYEEARRRGIETDAWFYRAMIIACGQVLLHAEQKCE